MDQITFPNQPPAPATATPEARLHFLDYWRVIRIRKAIIITVFLITAIIATAVTFILPESYASTCKLKVENDINDASGGTSPLPSQMTYDPYFIQTTFEIINSQLVLSNVIASLNLNVEWGKKFFNGETLKTTETMEILKGRMGLSPVKNTKLMAITVYSDDKNECALIANAIAEAYKNYRIESRFKYALSGLKVLQEQFLSESNQIQLSQEKIEMLRKSLDIHGDLSSVAPMPTLDADQLKKYNDEMMEKESAYQVQFVQFERLQSIGETNAPLLREVLPTIAGDSALSSLIDQYREAQRSYTAKLVDYAPIM